MTQVTIDQSSIDSLLRNVKSPYSPTIELTNGGMIVGIKLKGVRVNLHLEISLNPHNVSGRTGDVLVLFVTQVVALGLPIGWAVNGLAVKSLASVLMGFGLSGVRKDNKIILDLPIHNLFIDSCTIIKALGNVPADIEVYCHA